MGPLTYADYAALPDDGCRYELIDGELLVTPSPSSAHQWAVGSLHAILRQHVREKDLGLVFVSPLDVILTERSAPQPDVVFVERGNRERVTDRAIEGAPTLVVEVLSPSRPALDLVKKRKLYRENAIPHYWIADLEKRTLEGLVLGRDDYSTEARFSGDEQAVLSPFPGLVIPLSEVWMPPRRS
jgi:Uma2 family endonuclease